ncbi:DUF4130 domain-containing protein [Chryseobacterium nematophagum]|nr:DUF4130 domain-containing protein [Chryseobacterium nematophagum]
MRKKDIRSFGKDTSPILIFIIERKNLKLHIQHVPRRYWKYLTEKW